MPNVVGEDLIAATAQLNQVTSTPAHIVYQTTTTATNDTVLSQSPQATQPLPSNGPVTLTVAKVPTTVKVPRVVGENPNQATRELTGMGLEVSQVPQPIHNLAMLGLVVKQNPTSLTVVPKGSVITIYYGTEASSTGGGAVGGNTTTTQTNNTQTTTTTGSTTT